MSIRRLSATAAVAVAVAGLSAAVPLTTASAATTGTWFYAANGSTMYRVELVGTKVTTAKTIATSSNTNTNWEPMSALGSFATGTRGLYDKSTFSTKNALFTWDNAHHKLRILTSTSKDQVAWAALYNGGKNVAFIDQQKTKYTIRVVSSTGGTPSTKFTAPSGMSLTSLAASHDGKTFYVAGTTGTLPNAVVKLYKVAAGSKTMHALSTGFKGSYMSGLSLSPSGNTLAYSPSVYPPSKTGIRLVKVATGGVTKTIAYQGDASTISWSTDGTTLYNADQNANGWFKDSVKSGKSTALDFTSTGKYLYPVRA